MFFTTKLIVSLTKYSLIAPRIVFSNENRKSGNMLTLTEKARKVFSGLDETDYAILSFFCENGVSSKYEAKNYFEGKKAKTPIARATLYRRIKALKEKKFLKVVRTRRFKRGSLEADVEFISVDTPKSMLAVLGSGINPFAVFEMPNSEESKKMIKPFPIEKQIEFCMKILDSLVELGVDITNMKGSYGDIMEFYNTALLTRRPEYIKKIMSHYKVPNDTRKTIENFNKLMKALNAEVIDPSDS